jgi:hypothetical protein
MLKITTAKKDFKKLQLGEVRVIFKIESPNQEPTQRRFKRKDPQFGSLDI